MLKARSARGLYARTYVIGGGRPTVLSDFEQQRLIEIETQLQVDDPAFVQGFNGRNRRGLRSGWRRMAGVLAATVAMVVCGVGLALGDVGAVVIALVTIGGTAGLWVAGRHRLWSAHAESPPAVCGGAPRRIAVSEATARSVV
jgi:hypothetical protein